MKHIRQGPRECQLAVIAMLSDQSLDTVRKAACKGANVMFWAEALGTPYFWVGVWAAFDAVGLPNLTPIDWYHAQSQSDPSSPDLTGKGQLLVLWNDDTAHAMAFENGLVYDPNADGPMTWEAWIDEILPIYDCYGGIETLHITRL